MARLQDLKYDEEYVFSADYRELLDMSSLDKSRYHQPLVEAAEKLTQQELEWLWMDTMGTFECSHEDYEGVPKELLERAGPLVWFFAGYALALCDLT